MTAATVAPVPSDLFSLDGRVAVVTGASSGLGDRFTRVLHAAGATVVVAARRADRLQALADELGERVVPVGCDVTLEDDLVRLAGVAADVAGGAVDVLVNNAGVGAPAPAELEPMDDFRWVVDVNLNALFRLTQLVAVPMVEAGRGSVV